VTALGAALAVVAGLLAFPGVDGPVALSLSQPATTFAASIANLSEPAGYFDTDNLISNERSYLQVIPDLRRLSVRGGAYIGVGPDLNFSYIAEVRPAIAFIIDVRRDNLLLHLLFKALFELSGTRLEYIAHLTGRPLPPAVNGWRGAPIDRLIGYFDKSPVSREAVDARRARIDEAIRRTGVPLTADDLATIAAFHRRFMEDGLSLRFNSAGRPPQAHYPTYRDLLLETDSSGSQTNYLASEETFQFVKSMQAQDRIVPVVGDVSGPSALQAVGRAIAARGERLSAFYVSNVEFYLFGQGAFPRFVANLRGIPRSKQAVLIRSVFGRYSTFGRPGDASQSQVHGLDDLLDGYENGRYRSYGELVGR
jgi:hypothetical protein